MQDVRTCPVLLPAAFLLPVLILIAGCASPLPVRPVQPSAGNSTPWTGILLTDLGGQGTFTIRDLSARPVLVAVLSESCPSCVILLARQLDEIGRLPGVSNGSLAVVALDLDPEGPGFVAAHPGRSPFTGYEARAPENLTLQLLDRMGPFAIDPAQVPVILVCPGKDGLLLPPGVKTEPELNASITARC